MTGPIYTPVAEGLRGFKEDPSNPQAIQAYAKAVGNIYGPGLGYTDEIAAEEGWAPDPKDVRESLEQKVLKALQLKLFISLLLFSSFLLQIHVLLNNIYHILYH